MLVRQGTGIIFRINVFEKRCSQRHLLTPQIIMDLCCFAHLLWSQETLWCGFGFNDKVPKMDGADPWWKIRFKVRNFGLVMWWKVADFFSEPEFLNLAITAKRNKILMKLEFHGGSVDDHPPSPSWFENSWTRFLFASGPWVWMCWKHCSHVFNHMFCTLIREMIRWSTFDEQRFKSLRWMFKGFCLGGKLRNSLQMGNQLWITYLTWSNGRELGNLFDRYRLVSLSFRYHFYSRNLEGRGKFRIPFRDTRLTYSGATSCFTNERYTVQQLWNKFKGYEGWLVCLDWQVGTCWYLYFDSIGECPWGFSWMIPGVGC